MEEQLHWDANVLEFINDYSVIYNTRVVVYNSENVINFCSLKMFKNC